MLGFKQKLRGLITCTSAAVLFLSGMVSAQVSETVMDEAKALRDAAMKGSPAYTILESLTTEVGPRLAGTKEEAVARDWAVAKLKEMGFTNIRVEPFELPTWVRGTETGQILTPFPQKLYLTALGNSGSTGPEGMTGELVLFETLADLEAAPMGSLTGKIAYVGHAMRKTQNGSHYGFFGNARRRGPQMAAERGAKAILIRSIGTDGRRFPHTGGTSFNPETKAIPAAAVSNPDADQLERIATRGEPITVSLTLTPRQLGVQTSGNVIVDIKGSESPDEIIILGGHLDSWDLGTGAVDDGAGIAITTAAAKMILESGLKPKRTIRLVMWGAEEVGLLGARAYAKAHRAEIDQHMLGSESDFGAGVIYQVAADVSQKGQKVVDQMVRLLAPIGVAYQKAGGSSGPDLIPLNQLGLPSFRLAQDGLDYFDLHHTPDDTLDKVNPHQLDQNVASYLVFLWLAANTDADFRKVMK